MKFSQYLLGLQMMAGASTAGSTQEIFLNGDRETELTTTLPIGKIC